MYSILLAVGMIPSTVNPRNHAYDRLRVAAAAVQPVHHAVDANRTCSQHENGLNCC